MRILLVAGIFPPEVGGPATYAALMVQEMPKRGIEVEVLPFRAVRKWPPVIRHFLFLVKIILKARKVDVIFVQDTLSTGLAAVIGGIVSGKPVVLRAPGDWVWEQAAQRFGVKENIDDFQNKKYGFKVEFLRYLQRFTVSHADKVVAPSVYFAKLVSGWSGKEVVPVYNGIDLNHEAKEMLKYSVPTLITAGRLVPWKGIGHLISMLSGLPEWKLVIAGDGPEMANLKNLARGANLQERVVFKGYMSRQDLMDEIAKSHIFVLNTSFESFSFQVVEAMNLGTPVITTNIGNLPEIIEDGVSGFLVKPNDIEAIKSKIKLLSSDSGVRTGIIKKAKSKSMEFSIQKTMDKVAQVFKSFK